MEEEDSTSLPDLARNHPNETIKQKLEVVRINCDEARRFIARQSIFPFSSTPEEKATKLFRDCDRPRPSSHPSLIERQNNRRQIAFKCRPFRCAISRTKGESLRLLLSHQIVAVCVLLGESITRRDKEEGRRLGICNYGIMTMGGKFFAFGGRVEP